MLNKTMVPDKLHGYLIQVKHMLYELISLDNRVVSIEKLDDVAIEIDGIVIAEQLSCGPRKTCYVNKLSFSGSFSNRTFVRFAGGQG